MCSSPVQTNILFSYSLCYACPQKPQPEQDTSPELISQLLFLSVSLCIHAKSYPSISMHTWNKTQKVYALVYKVIPKGQCESLFNCNLQIWTSETGQDWVCFAEDGLSGLEISSCFLLMFSFWEASKAHSGSHWISGSFLAKPHQHLKTFSSATAAEGSWLPFKKKTHKMTLNHHITYGHQFCCVCTSLSLHRTRSRQVQGWGNKAKDGASLSRLNGRFKHRRWQWSQLFRAGSQPCFAMLETRYGS